LLPSTLYFSIRQRYRAGRYKISLLQQYLPVSGKLTQPSIKQSLGKPYKYRLRPEYGSEKFLLEFLLDNKDTEFGKDLLTALKDINPKIDAVEDLWMNDEVLLNVSSDKGAFTLSKDIWGFAFILAENNQPCIDLIDEILSNSDLFEKEVVDFKDYKNLKT
jgi:hypothetical protein